jgi:hypothetical protein
MPIGPTSLTPQMHHDGTGARSRLETWLAFTFGVIFLAVLLSLATIVKNPEPFAVRIYLTVLALAGAGAGAVLPGFLDLRYKSVFRAGGSLAVFALIYLNSPSIGASVTRVVIPKTDPMPVAHAFFDALATGDPSRSWALLPAAARQQVDSEAAWDKLYASALRPLGNVQHRELVGEAAQTSPPGWPPGAYKGLTFRTRFANDDAPRAESLVLRGNDREQWEVFSYQVSLATVH